MDRLANYVFILVLSFLFVIVAGPDAQLRIIIALTWGTIFCLGAFFLKWLTLDGAISALVLGTFTLGIGKIESLVLILTFFLSSVLLTGKTVISREEGRYTYLERERRDGLQVWANGFWFILFLIPAFIAETQLYILAASAAVATATADTWGTELGSKRFGGTTYLFYSFVPVKPGTDGGVSVTGTLGALGGSIMIGLVAMAVFGNVHWAGMFIISCAGFLGSFADSYLGATFQYRNVTFTVPMTGKMVAFEVDNNFVNWFATGFGSVAALILNLILL